MAIDYTILKNIAVLSERNGWAKEVNIVSWNGRQPKVDIRDWSADHSKCGKGLTLTDEEAETLVMALHNHIAERGE